MKTWYDRKGNLGYARHLIADIYQKGGTDVGGKAVKSSLVSFAREGLQVSTAMIGLTENRASAGFCHKIYADIYGRI